MSTQTVYEYMIEQKLLDKVLEACENDEHREAALKTAKKLLKMLNFSLASKNQKFLKIPL